MPECQTTRESHSSTMYTQISGNAGDVASVSHPDQVSQEARSRQAAYSRGVYQFPSLLFFLRPVIRQHDVDLTGLHRDDTSVPSVLGGRENAYIG